MNRTGRVLGVLVLVQLVGLIVPFILIKPASYSTFLGTAAASATQVRIGVALLLVNALVTLALSLRAFPSFRRSGEGAALGLVALAVMWFAVQAIDNGHLLSMLSLSQRSAEVGATSGDALQTIGSSLYSTRRFIHFTELFVIDLWFFAFYALLFRSASVPRGLAAFGMLMAIVHCAAVPLPVFAGGKSVMALAPCLALSHLAIGVWLLVKGFAAPAEATGATRLTSLQSAG